MGILGRVCETDAPFHTTSVHTPQGRLTTALEYLEYVPGEASTTVAVLKDRIYRSGAPLPQVSHRLEVGGWICPPHHS